MTSYDATSTLPLQKSFVNGAYVDSTSGEAFETRHPGNDQVICQVETAGHAEVDAAVAAAKAAFTGWSQTPAAERGAVPAAR